MKPKQGRYKYSNKNRRLIASVLQSNGCDRGGIYTVIESIEHLITIYLKVKDRDEAYLKQKDVDEPLPRKPSERKLIIEEVKAGERQVPKWLKDWLIPESEDEIIEKLLESSHLKRDHTNEYIRDFLIKELADLHVRVTGIKKSIPVWRPDRELYEGEFFDFLAVCLEPLGYKHIKSNSALGKSIIRILE